MDVSVRVTCESKTVLYIVMPDLPRFPTPQEVEEFIQFKLGRTRSGSDVALANHGKYEEEDMTYKVSVVNREKGTRTVANWQITSRKRGGLRHVG